MTLLEPYIIAELPLAVVQLLLPTRGPDYVTIISMPSTWSLSFVNRSDGYFCLTTSRQLFLQNVPLYGVPDFRCSNSIGKEAEDSSPGPDISPGNPYVNVRRKAI